MSKGRKKLPYKRTDIGHYIRSGSIAEVLHIIDGDTFDIEVFINLQDRLQNMDGSVVPETAISQPIGIKAILNCRLYGLDAREKNDPLHSKIVDHLKELLHKSSNRVRIDEVMTECKDKWGRLLLKVSLRDEVGNVVDLTQYLLDLRIDGRRIANEYYGGTKIPFDD